MRDELDWQRAYGRYRLRKWAFEKVPRWLAFRLPKSLAYWCAIRVIAVATTGQYGNQIVPELKAMDALDRFDYDPHKMRERPSPWLAGEPT